MRVRVQVDAARTSAEFKEARRTMRAHAKTGLIRAAERVALPRVRVLTPGVVQRALTVRATSSAAYLTTRGPRSDDRILGLLNFGGTVREWIMPKTKRAIRLPSGDVVARVTTPRIYEGKHFIERGIDAAHPEYPQAVSQEVMKAFGSLNAPG